MVLKAHALTELGVLAPDINPVLMNSRGARELVGLADLYGDEQLSLMFGYKVKRASPILASYARTGVTTVTTSNGSKIIADSGATFMTNATIASRVYPGDFFLGPDLKLYVVDSVDSDTQITLRTAYEGASISPGTSCSYTIIHRLWMLKQFYSQISTGYLGSTSQDYKGTSSGTFVNTRADSYGVSLTPDIRNTQTFVRSSGIHTVLDTANKRTSYALKFTVSSNTTINAIVIGLARNDQTTKQFRLIIEGNSGGLPDGTAIHANASTSTLDWAAVPVWGEGNQGLSPRFNFTGSFTLYSGTTYWLRIDLIGAADGTSLMYVASGAASNFTLFTTTGNCKVRINSVWYDIGDSEKPAVSLVHYPTSGTNTYTSPALDLGYTPGSTWAGVATIAKESRDYLDRCTTAFACNLVNPFGSGSYGNFLYSGPAFPDTLSWDLKTADNPAMSGATTILSGKTTLSETISASANNKRYWQFVFSFTSASGASSPLVVGSSVGFTIPGIVSSSADVAGVGPYVYHQIFGTPTSISSSEVPSGNPAGVTVFQSKLFWTTGGGPPRYWNGISNAANVDALLKNDFSAGIDPLLRADRLTLHNDKLFLYRNAASPTAYSRVSTTLTDTVLTDTGSSFPSGTDKLIGHRCYPCIDDASATKYNYPFKFWIVTNSTATTATCSGGTMLSVAAVGDTYLIVKSYNKVAWYCTETEPADWPTTNLLQFNEEDGDIIQHMESWNGRLVIVCREQLWSVQGYGPTTGWSKQLLAPRGGTLSPWSVVAGEDSLFWWGLRGIVGYGGMYNGPAPISDALRSLVLTSLREPMRDHIVGVKYRGLIFWSYPYGSSNVNNKTIIYHPQTGRWVQQDFGMYIPTVFIDDTGEEVLYFQDPTTGNILQWSDDSYTFGANSQPFSFKSSYIISSTPTERAQFITVRATIVSAASLGINVGYAKEYSDVYTSAGVLTPIDGSATGRTNVNTQDVVYVCRLPLDAKASSLSIRLSGATQAALRILSIEVTSDSVESATFG